MLAIYYTLFIIGTAVVSVLGFFLYQIAMQPKKTLMSIVGIVVALVLYFLMYFSGSSDTMKTLALRHEASDAVIAATSAGVYTIGICISVGLLVVVFGPFMGKLRSSRK
jgi:phosphotransferase system  glucose/maltose/N-acetylglucosamine-specific IIC component